MQEELGEHGAGEGTAVWVPTQPVVQTGLHDRWLLLALTVTNSVVGIRASIGREVDEIA